MAELKDFVAMILCHGRPHNTPTFNTLRKYGYTGKILIVCDDEDETVPEYRKEYGEENVVLFSKDEIAKEFDTMDQTKDKKCAVYARNACFHIAREQGYKYFCELDDDYVTMPYRYAEGDTLYRSRSADLDEVFKAYIDFMDCHSEIYSVAFAQPGDLIGGTNSHIWIKGGVKRKCMNSWICDVDKPFTFNGTMNDDVNTYLSYGRMGKIFLTFTFIMIDQPETQREAGGMTDMYKGNGTYMKTFYTIMCNPSFVRIDMMGATHYRIHHHIDWPHAVPKIISSDFKINKVKQEDNKNETINQHNQTSGDVSKVSKGLF